MRVTATFWVYNKGLDAPQSPLAAGHQPSSPYGPRCDPGDREESRATARRKGTRPSRTPSFHAFQPVGVAGAAEREPGARINDPFMKHLILRPRLCGQWQRKWLNSPLAFASSSRSPGISDPKDVRCSSTLLTHSKGSENGTNRLRLQKQILKTEKNRPLDPEMQCLLLSDGKGSIHPNHVVILPGDSGSGTAAISFTGALKIPGVIEFSLCLLFAKLVSYTFLFWLPLYITNVDHLDAKKAGELSTLFDVGGIFGGILAGVISDRLEKRASTCGLMLLLAAPTLYIFSTISKMGLEATIAMLLLSGALVSGPYALITTAVSADLGTHKSLKGNAHALSTVTAIIDGTGSVGAALGPLLAGLLSPSGWSNVFYMLMFADACALLVSRPIFSPIHLECGSLWLWPNTGGTFSRAFLSYQTDLGLPIFSKYA
ncbi:PREDICTED: glycerol-3-phosphate transporter isoform X3 [Cercocebus atys]|uniref:glycerol-3-phosphate transporter isoform X3 n=1 Tax=Cercocebus atys TaxID=9531 RepID=UPI0005F36DE0|nr:PREDICTED: glycerol-3-phosphate transporter isoform X3 [Cercocebus atys]